MNSKHYSNYQDFLKTLALLSMIIDHVGFYLFPDIVEFRALGRFAMPIFGFFAGYNFKDKIRWEVAIYGVLLTLVSLSLRSVFFVNILVAIFIGYIYIQYFYYLSSKFLNNLIQFIVILIFVPLTFEYLDSGTLMALYMVIGYLLHNRRLENKNIYLAILTFTNLVFTQICFNFSIQVFLSIVILHLIIYLCLASNSFVRDIHVNYRPISRNMINIYFWHIIVLELAYIVFIRH